MNNNNLMFLSSENKIIQFTKEISSIFKNYQSIDNIEIFKVSSTYINKGKIIEKKEYIDLLFTVIVNKKTYKVLNNSLIKEIEKNNFLRELNLTKKTYYFSSRKDKKTESEIKTKILSKSNLDNVLVSKLDKQKSFKFSRINLKNDISMFLGKAIVSKKELSKLKTILIERKDLKRKLKI